VSDNEHFTHISGGAKSGLDIW